MTNKKTALVLANGVRDYIRTRRDKKEVEFLKDKPQIKNGVSTKGINIRLAAIGLEMGVDKELIKAIENSKKEKSQSVLSFQQGRFKSLKDLMGDSCTNSDLETLLSERVQFIADLDAQYDVALWLDGWALKAKDISFATHVAKLTHSSSKSSSVLDMSKESDSRYLTTNTLSSPVIDTASSCAASLPIADILKISVEGYSILDCLRNGEHELFEYFTTDSAKIQRWVMALKQAYNSDTKRSCFLSKQVYFPLSTGEYHILLPLVSSSLMQALHGEHKSYFEDEQVNARESRRLGKQCDTPAVNYPNKARLNITASNHINASVLNAKRGGKMSLLSAEPPKWRQNNVFSLKQDEFYTSKLSRHLRDETVSLSNYLRLIKSKALSDRSPVRAKIIMEKLDMVIAGLLDYVTQVNREINKCGWTAESALSIDYQLLFEPCRDDTLATNYKLCGKWQEQLSGDFSFWLRGQLNKTNGLSVTLAQTAPFEKIFTNALREYVAIQEVAE
jgi:CRISPR-associated protein Csy1